MKKNVIVPMYAGTLDTISKLKSLLSNSNRSQIIKDSIEITFLVIKTLKSGGRVILIAKDGGEKDIVIPGVAGK